MNGHGIICYGILAVVNSQLICAGVATIFVTPSCNSAATLSIASGDNVMGSCDRWQFCSAQVPQNASLQHVVMGTPDVRISVGMSCPPARRMHARGAWATTFCTAMHSLYSFGGAFADCTCLLSVRGSLGLFGLYLSLLYGRFGCFCCQLLLESA